jgi:hypothetical protein
MAKKGNAMMITNTGPCGSHVMLSPIVSQMGESGVARVTGFFDRPRMGRQLEEAMLGLVNHH